MQSAADPQQIVFAHPWDHVSVYSVDFEAQRVNKRPSQFQTSGSRNIPRTWNYANNQHWQSSNPNSYMPKNALQNVHFSSTKLHSWAFYQSLCEEVLCEAVAAAPQRAVQCEP